MTIYRLNTSEDVNNKKVDNLLFFLLWNASPIKLECYICRGNKQFTCISLMYVTTFKIFMTFMVFA